MVSPFKRDPLESDADLLVGAVNTLAISMFPKFVDEFAFIPRDERGQRYWDFVITIAGVVCTEDLNPHVMVLAGGPPIFDSYVLSLHKPGVAQALVKGSRRVSPKSNKIMQHRERTKF